MEKKELSKKKMRNGLFWIVGGVIFTLITYSVATPGGTYIVAYGAVLYGIMQFITGVVQYFNS